MPVTCKDIAAEVGVSRQAVSAVLSGSGNSRVSREKQTQILRIARNMRYVPNRAALSLSGKATRTIGLVTDGYGGIGPYRLEKVQEQLYLSGFMTQAYSFFGAQHGHRALAQILASGVDGVILPQYIFEDIRHEDLPIPAILHGLGKEISIDYEQASFTATDHLARKHGRKQIALVFGERVYGNVFRSTGYRKALEQNNIAFDPKLEFALRDRAEDADRLLHLISQRRLEAIVATDSLAMQLIAHMCSSGIRVPEEVAIIGSDGLSSGNFAHVALSTVAEPATDFAQALTAMMIDKIERRMLTAYPEDKLIPGVLIPNRSCGCEKITTPKIHAESTFAYDPRIDLSIYENKRGCVV